MEEVSASAYIILLMDFHSAFFLLLLVLCCRREGKWKQNKTRARPLDGVVIDPYLVSDGNPRYPSPGVGSSQAGEIALLKP